MRVPLPFRLCGSVASSRLTRLHASPMELPGRPHGHCPECQLPWLSSLRQQLPCCLPQSPVHLCASSPPSSAPRSAGAGAQWRCRRRARGMLARLSLYVHDFGIYAGRGRGESPGPAGGGGSSRRPPPGCREQRAIPNRQHRGGGPVVKISGFFSAREVANRTAAFAARGAGFPLQSPTGACANNGWRRVIQVEVRTLRGWEMYQLNFCQTGI
jgi:hypothetical protein